MKTKRWSQEQDHKPHQEGAAPVQQKRRSLLSSLFGSSHSNEHGEIPEEVLRNLASGDRKCVLDGGTQVQKLIQEANKDDDKIRSICSTMLSRLIHSDRATERIGGLAGFHGVVLSLAQELPCFIEVLLPPVLHVAHTDHDVDVRIAALDVVLAICAANNGFLFEPKNNTRYAAIADMLSKAVRSSSRHAKLQQYCKDKAGHFLRCVAECLPVEDGCTDEAAIELDKALKELMADISNPAEDIEPKMLLSLAFANMNHPKEFMRKWALQWILLLGDVQPVGELSRDLNDLSDD